MKEKKNSLSTFFLLLALITLVVMGVFIYKLNDEKTREVQNSTVLQAQINNLNKTIDELQEELNILSEATVIDNTSDNSELSEDFIKNEFETAWSIFKKSYDIFQYDSNDSIDLPVENQNYTWKYYKITNYDEVVNRYISSSFSNVVGNMELIIYENNNYYIMDSTDGTSLDRIDEINNIEKTNDKISCIVKVHLESYTGLDDENSLEKNYEFELIKENNNWKINKFNLAE